ncbi:MAG TPA: hypothetical protein VEL76_14935 [Gemmataceae bacterium]|nr:hypothetical protein [Gemmataceae bacterium]
MTVTNTVKRIGSTTFTTWGKRAIVMTRILGPPETTATPIGSLDFLHNLR